MSSRNKEDGDPLSRPDPTPEMTAEELQRSLESLRARQLQLEQQHQELEERLRAQNVQIQLQAETIAAAAEGIIITDGTDWLDSRISFVNEAISIITGYLPDDLIGSPRRILNGSATDHETLNLINQTLSTFKPFHGELLQHRKDGTPYHAELSITPMKDARGQKTGFVSIHRDITAWKNREQRLQDSEEQLRQMAAHSPAMVWMSGTDKLCTWANQQWLDFTGHSLDQELGSGWVDGVHPDDLERCLKIYSESFDARQPFKMEYRVRRHDGEWRWVNDAGNPMYREDGLFVGYIGSCTDVTERRETEDTLRESEERLRAILNTASDSIITIDRNGIITGANPATERIFGYKPGELLGQNVKILMPSPHREEHDTYIKRYLETGEAHIIGLQRETVALRRDGSTFPVELAVSEIGHLGLFVGIHRDISARKQTEQALEQYRKNLQTVSAEFMLAEERQRQQLAQDLHDGLGHNLFRARLKLDQLRGAGPVVDEINAILEEIAKMVNTLTFELSPPVLRLLGLRPAVHWLARDMKQRYGLSIEIDEDADVYPVDERLAVVLFRSLRELMINVAKHAQTDNAALTIRTLDRAVQFFLEDRGKGFDPTDRFGQLESGRFGLFSIRERLEYLQGTFEIDSAPGKGTRITLTAPLAKKARGHTV
jgi:PAS domain S-box-containing protein